MADFLEDIIEHSWGKSPKQKAREKEYNAEYYRKNKEKWAKTYSDIKVPTVEGEHAVRPRYEYGYTNMKKMGSGIYPKTKTEEAEWKKLGRKEINGEWYEPDKEHVDWRKLEQQATMQLMFDSFGGKTHNQRRAAQAAAANEAQKAKDQAQKNRDKNAQKQVEEVRAYMVEQKKRANAKKYIHYRAELARDKTTKSAVKKAKDFVDGVVTQAFDVTIPSYKKAGQAIGKGVKQWFK